MKPTLLRPLLITTLFALPTLAHAHPGHEGHEFGWDFDHLTAHPLATVLCGVALVAGGWMAARLIRAQTSKVKVAASRPDDQK